MKYISLLSVLLLAGCLSITEGNKQKIMIKTSAPAECTLNSTKQNLEFSAPGEIEIEKSYNPLEIICKSKSSGKTGNVKALSDIPSRGYGTAVIGTIIGGGVDAYTGAAFEYPSEIVVEFGKTKMVGQSKLNSNVDFE